MATQARSIEDHDRLAADMVLAFNARDEAALRRFNQHYGRSFTFDDLWAEVWRRLYSFRQRAFKQPEQKLEVAEAQLVIAQDAGFGSWDALTESISGGPTQPVPPFAIDGRRITPNRQLSDRDWDALIAAMQEHHITVLNGAGVLTDAVVARIAELEDVTSVSLAGSRLVTDDGLLLLARMPQLEVLNLSEYPGGNLTDRGLAVLRDLPNLRHFEMTWQRGISDEGVANLKYCDRLEHVNLMGSPTGDGAIAALQDKPNLRYFSTGRLATDAGLPLLQNFPRLKRWEGEGSHLLADGPFTNDGLAALRGLEGVAELDLFWHVTQITPDGFVHLALLPNLMSLGADGELSNDVSMRHFAEIPRLRRLRAQGAVATDTGFEALSQSQTLEGFWGRECPNLTGRGFVALSKMPALRSLGVSCKRVDDAALSTLPDFPSLRELTPIDVSDEGFRHVGRCKRLERLTCMYCRTTTDAATQHVAELSLKYYYAGLTQITDHSLEILGRMESLERIDLYECQHVTDAGLPFLAKLPNLREIQLEGLPGVTFQGTRVFPAHIRVTYTT